MSILNQDLGFREITMELLESIGFKPTRTDLWVNGVQLFPYDLFIKIPKVTEYTGKHHLVRYFPNDSKLVIYENKDAWSYETRREVYVDYFEDIEIFVENYRR